MAEACIAGQNPTGGKSSNLGKELDYQTDVHDKCLWGPPIKGRSKEIISDVKSNRP